MKKRGRCGNVALLILDANNDFNGFADVTRAHPLNLRG